jgi:hypothetical protein
MDKQKTHVSQMSGPPPEGSPIAVADHCMPARQARALLEDAQSAPEFRGGEEKEGG